jgi:lysophospholipase L1-like esterase
MKRPASRLTIYPSVFLLFLLLLVTLPTQSFSFDSTKIFFAGDSATTYCFESLGGPDLYYNSLFSRLKAAPPPGFTIEPQQDIVSQEPCGTSHTEVNGYGVLKILDWNTECRDPSGNSVCSWACNHCPEPECEINRSVTALGGEADWCCCASRKACIEQSDAKYVILSFVGNDLLQLFNFYDSDVDQVVEEARSLTNYVTSQGRTVIWLSFYPAGYGSLGNGETACFDLLSCLFAVNSNVEYFYEQFIPWINSQPDVYMIDFFAYIKETYAPDPISFIDTYGYDGLHLKPSGHQIFYDYLYPRLTALLAEIVDQDEDGMPNTLDNCPATPNSTTLGTCLLSTIATTCRGNEDCGVAGICSMNQEDTYPPQGNHCGDACECEGNFDGDDDCDGTDASIFKADFGRMEYDNPCTDNNPCHGDFDCDSDCDGTDASTFKADFGRNQYQNPCPNCITVPWCSY